MNKTIFLLLTILLNLPTLSAQQNTSRWSINDQGGVTWKIEDRIPHHDHMEMSGKKISAVVSYGVESDNSFFVKRDLVWPMLRTIPNNTHASLMHAFSDDIIKSIKIDGSIVNEKVTEISLDGTIEVKSLIGEDIELTRTFFPSTEMPVYYEKYVIFNRSDKSIKIDIPELEKVIITEKKKGVDGEYSLTYKISGGGKSVLKDGESLYFSLSITGEKDGENYTYSDVERELKNRKSLIDQLWSNLILETPDIVLNRGFAFAKIRASESIYQTKGGPMHGPGGLSYYAAIWANDQAEYVNPFFPYLGYDYANESVINSFEHFARFMNDKYEPIPSSIIAEGIDIWNGAGDRGDAAMIAYGAARFAMSYGDRDAAKKLWPLIEWCLEYNHRKLNKHGVVASNTDELEGRFPTGKANLCTSSLYYDALLSAAWLGKSLGKDEKLLNTYRLEAIR